jgi:hypothetical protein
MSGTEGQESTGAEGPAKFGSLAGAIGAKNLIIIIIAMPFVFLVAVLGIIALFGKPNEVSEAGAAGDGSVSNVEHTPLEATSVNADMIRYPVGAAPGAISLDGDRLAVRIDGPDGVEVVIYDLTKGEVIARIALKAETGAPSP